MHEIEEETKTEKCEKFACEFYLKGKTRKLIAHRLSSVQFLLLLHQLQQHKWHSIQLIYCRSRSYTWVSISIDKMAKSTFIPKLNCELIALRTEYDHKIEFKWNSFNWSHNKYACQFLLLFFRSFSYSIGHKMNVWFMYVDTVCYFDFDFKCMRSTCANDEMTQRASHFKMANQTN